MPTEAECLASVEVWGDIYATYQGHRQKTVTLSLDWAIPKLFIKSVMNLNMNSGKGRVIVLEATEDIYDIANYGFAISNNGNIENQEATLPSSVDLVSGEQLFIVKSEEDINTYFNLPTDSTDLTMLNYRDLVTNNVMGLWNFDGDDTFQLKYLGYTIDTYGVPGFDGSNLPWEYTNSWAVRYDYDNTFPLQ